MPDILTEQHISDATKVAKRLHKEFVPIMQLPPIVGLRASEMKSLLSIGRMTCQRMLKFKSDVPPTSRLLTEIPGFSGLREFLIALRHKGIPEAVLCNADSAVDNFAHFLTSIGMSQTALATALSRHFEATDPKHRLARRKKLYEAASSVLGQSMGSTISILAFKFNPGADTNFEQIATRGYTNISVSHSAMPIRLPINAGFADYRKIKGSEGAREPQELIKEFSSTPLPSIDTRTIKEENLAHIIDPENIPNGEPFNCFAMQCSKWNVITPIGKHKALWLYIDYPSRSCTFDVYFQKNFADANRISSDCHLWGTSLLAPPEDLWMTRFAGQLCFTELGQGISNSDSSNYKRHKELTLNMFKKNNWNPAEFVGFRCEIEMPIWRSGICITLDERT
tara:strand:+ start:1011 stop:2195 length:1185 start_codon:yes stop_codon:yes gene_type:complete